MPRDYATTQKIYLNKCHKEAVERINQKLSGEVELVEEN